MKEKKNVKLGRKSLLATVTINRKFSKIYFSVKAVKDLNLLQRQYMICKEGKSWFLSFDLQRSSLKTTVHQGAFYVVSRKLVTELADDFPGKGLIVFVIRDTQSVADKYLLIAPDRSNDHEQQAAKDGGKIPGRSGGMVVRSSGPIGVYQCGDFDKEVSIQKQIAR